MKRTPLRARPAASRRHEPGYQSWHTPTVGECSVCGARGLLLRHHVVTEQTVRRFGGDPWDLRNAMQLGYYACQCHRDHHAAARRIPLSKVPPEAVDFAIDLLGGCQGADYLAQYYAA